MTNAEDLIALIRDDMRDAMKNQRRVELNELRSILALISNAEAVGVQSRIVSVNVVAGATNGVGSTEAEPRELTLAEVRAIILAEKQEMEDALSRIDENTEFTTELREKIAVAKRYL